MALYVLHYDDRVLDANSRDGPGQQPVFFCFFFIFFPSVGKWGGCLVVTAVRGGQEHGQTRLSTHMHTHTTHTHGWMCIIVERKEACLLARLARGPPLRVTLLAPADQLGRRLGAAREQRLNFLPSLTSSSVYVCVCVCVSIQHMRDYGRTECTALSWSSSSLPRRAGLWCIARWFISFFFIIF